MKQQRKVILSIAAIVAAIVSIQVAHGADLVAHYTFDDPNDLGRDSSPFENHADEVFEVETVEGQFGTAAFFDESLSSSFNILGGLEGFTGKPGVTLAAWVKLDEATTGFDGIISQDGGSCCQNRILLHPENQPFINLSEHDDRHLTEAPTFEFGDWTHIAMTGMDLDGGGAEARVYVNFEEIDGSPQEFPTMDDGSGWNTYLGVGEAGTAHRLTGALDDVRIYEGALSAAEIVELQNSDVGPPTPRFVGGEGTIGSRLFAGDVSNKMFGPVQSGVPGWNARIVTFDEHGETLDNHTTAVFVLEDFEGQPGDGAFPVVDFGGGGGSFGSTQPYPNGDATAGQDDFVVEATANVTIPAGSWTIGIGSDDGGRVLIGDEGFEIEEWSANADPNSGFNEVRFEGNRGHSWTVGTFTLDEPLETTITASMHERGGGDSFEVAILNDSLDTDQLSTDPAAVPADGWELLADGTFGWSVTTEAAPLVSADLSAEVNAVLPWQFDVNGDTDMADQIVVTNPDADVFTSILNIDGITIQVNGTGALANGDAFTIIDADTILGTPIITSVDPNQNWVFDASTGTVILQAPTTLCDPNTLGDANGDGMVAFADFLILAENFGNNAGVDHTDGDVNCDGQVAFADFLILAENFGQSVAGAQAVPEPSCGLLFCIGFIMLTLSMRRRR